MLDLLQGYTFAFNLDFRYGPTFAPLVALNERTIPSVSSFKRSRLLRSAAISARESLSGRPRLKPFSSLQMKLWPSALRLS
jgi:hypothetical protein